MGLHSECVVSKSLTFFPADVSTAFVKLYGNEIPFEYNIAVCNLNLLTGHNSAENSSIGSNIEYLLSHFKTGGIQISDDPNQVKQGVREGFLDIDRHMHKMARQDNWDRSGSTAAAVMISPRYIYFINCGDSRTLLCHDGQVAFYTEDHKPFNPREKERIQNAGGSVTLQRVNGSLAVSRALGDFDFKEVDWRPQTEQLVSPEPEVYELERTPEDEFLILACDGVWDAIGNEELCAFVRSRLKVCNDLREICAQVIDLCLYKVSS